MKLRALLLVAAVILPVATAACSSDDGGTSTGGAEEISRVLREESGVPKDIADCLGAAFAQAGISAEEANLDDITDLSTERRATVNQALSDCAGSAVTLPE